MSRLKLGVVDQSPVRTGGTAADALLRAITTTASLEPGCILFEGSGASIPPVEVDRTVCILGAGRAERSHRPQCAGPPGDHQRGLVRRHGIRHSAVRPVRHRAVAFIARQRAVAVAGREGDERISGHRCR